jgi:hypothetical protein
LSGEIPRVVLAAFWVLAVLCCVVWYGSCTG